tara:strand:- start:171 stop:620 length:450 start_codon:yes stop_codon:yes gene_type:complete
MEQDLTNDAVKAVMSAYTPIEVKTLLHNHDEKCFVHHQDIKDIVQFYHDYFEDIHHWLLDDSHAYEYYYKAQAAYNYAQAKCKTNNDRFALQQHFIKDVVYIFIATVCYDLAASHDMLDMTMQEVEDYQLSVDLEHRKNQLQVIDGGKS